MIINWILSIKFFCPVKDLIKRIKRKRKKKKRETEREKYCMPKLSRKGNFHEWLACNRQISW